MLFPIGRTQKACCLSRHSDIFRIFYGQQDNRDKRDKRDFTGQFEKFRDGTIGIGTI
jgi:hypothetical protein